MKKVFFISALAAFFVVFNACEKEEDGAAYVGLWETVVYPAIDPMSQQEIVQKIEFDFQEASFQADVYNGVSADSLELAIGVKGNILSKTDSEMSVELMKVGINATEDRLTWFSKDVPEDTVSYNRFIGLVSTTIPEKFDATYNIDGKNLNFIIPAANDTIYLFKK